jgi:hypothetical protein
MSEEYARAVSANFEAIAAIAQMFLGLAAAAGVWVAYSQLIATRRARLVQRRSQVAEDLISLAFNAEDALKEIRNPMTTIPKDKVADKTFSYQLRYDRIVKHNDLFQDLRDAQIRVRAVIGDEQVDSAVEALFSARLKVGIAIQILAEMANDGSIDVDNREHVSRLRSEMSGGFSGSDEVGISIDDAVKTIESRLSPVARIEGQF